MDNFRKSEIDRAIASLETNQSLLIIGDEGTGKSAIADGVRTAFHSRGWKVAIAEYSGSAKATLIEICEQLGCDYEDHSGNKPRPFTADEMREEIKQALNQSHTLLICDNAHRYPVSMRYWLQDCIGDRALLLLLATTPPRKDLFLKMPRIAIQGMSSAEIREIMIEEAEEIGLKLPASKIAELEQRCGGNPFLARRVVRELSLDLGENEEGDRIDYIDGTPFLIAALSMIGVVRLIGLGLGDRSMYIIGGIATISAISIRLVLMRANMRNKSRIES
ncbi:MAG: ATP-binding protein [Pseudanabaena sp. M34BS1SP1A06MG]|nr:ATP-binding protein [Pseudanabaena sp. M34BS1SP1A06MG]